MPAPIPPLHVASPTQAWPGPADQRERLREPPPPSPPVAAVAGCQVGPGNALPRLPETNWSGPTRPVGRSIHFRATTVHDVSTQHVWNFLEFVGPTRIYLDPLKFSANFTTFQKKKRKSGNDGTAYVIFCAREICWSLFLQAQSRGKRVLI